METIKPKMNTNEENMLGFLTYVSRKVPYYRDIFNQYRIGTKDLNDFKKIPVLTKEIIQKEQLRLISDDYHIEDLYSEKTSGSSGMPLKCYYDYREKVRRGMELWKERKRNCPDIFGKSMVSFHGGGRRAGVDLEIVDNVLYINYMTMTQKKLKEIYKTFCDFNPFFIRGLPSIMHTFVRYCRENSLPLEHLNVRYVEFLGEYVLPSVQDDLRLAFPKSMVCNFYGSQEFFCMAYSCKYDNLHVAGSSVYIETQHEDDEGFGEILVTGYKNNVMPFIRYKIGDVGKVSHSDCLCGREHPTLILKSSRVMEYIIQDDMKINGDIFKTCLSAYEANIGRSVISRFQVTQTTSKLDFEIGIHLSDNTGVTLSDIRDYLQKSIYERIHLHFNIKVIEQEEFQLDPKTMKFKMYNFIK